MRRENLYEKDADEDKISEQKMRNKTKCISYQTFTRMEKKGKMES